MLAPIGLCEGDVREAKGWIVGDNFLADFYSPVKLTGASVRLQYRNGRSTLSSPIP